ncbi:hypothetical protein MARI_05390 [Marinobacter sp. JH2]|nr:hypothetical protein MARI_05390 [Marinobacter sp. JH2]
MLNDQIRERINATGQYFSLLYGFWRRMELAHLSALILPAENHNFAKTAASALATNRYTVASLPRHRDEDTLLFSAAECHSTARLRNLVRIGHGAPRYIFLNKADF